MTDASIARTRLIRRELELGSWTYATRAPHHRLAPLMYRDLYGFTLSGAGFSSWLEPPRPALTLMIDLDGAISVEHEQLPDSWFGGLTSTYAVVGFDGGAYGSIDLEFNPLGAYRILGMPLSELEGIVVSLEDLFGAHGRALAEQVRALEDWDRRFDVVERFLLARLTRGPGPTPAVEWAWWRLRSSGGNCRVEQLAAEIGCSRRYLLSRFRAEVGLPPKTAGRLVRFEQVCKRLRAAPTRWAQIAADAGYCDQPHLNRDFRELAGTTPSEFLARCIPGGGVVGDGVAVSAGA